MLAKFSKHNISIRFRDRMTLQSTVIGHPVPKLLAQSKWYRKLLISQGTCTWSLNCLRPIILDYISQEQLLYIYIYIIIYSQLQCRMLTRWHWAFTSCPQNGLRVTVHTVHDLREAWIHVNLNFLWPYIPESTIIAVLLLFCILVNMKM